MQASDRKEVMPHRPGNRLADAVSPTSVSADTTPPQASEPGATDELLARLDALAREPEPTGRMMSQWDAIRSMLLMVSRGGSYPRDIFESIIQQFADCCGEAATEIRRLRVTEAEQAARVAALESGLRRAERALQPFASLGRVASKRNFVEVRGAFKVDALRDAALSALKPGDRIGGCVLVPEEPTEAMHDAFFRARDVDFPRQRERGGKWKTLPAVVYAAMLAAIPEAPDAD